MAGPDRMGALRPLPLLLLTARQSTCWRQNLFKARYHWELVANVSQVNSVLAFLRPLPSLLLHRSTTSTRSSSRRRVTSAYRSILKCKHGGRMLKVRIWSLVGRGCVFKGFSTIYGDQAWLIAKQLCGTLCHLHYILVLFSVL